MAFISSFLLLLAAILTVVSAVDETVQLSYATYKGQKQSDGTTQWLGVRYAKAPVGGLRFAAPQDPDSISGVQPAVQHGNICFGLNGGVSAGHSEDCLFLDVYAPTSATTNSSLPVFFYIQGGGFTSDSNPNLDGRGLIKAAGGNILVVTLNYRVGPFGFLAAKEVSSLNNGLLDQRKALQWAQDNIAKFGGDPKHVVLGGDSAGGASITFHMTAYGGASTKLFQAAAGQSASFGTVLSVPQSQYQYDILVGRLSCTNQSNTLACLRNKTAADIQAVNTVITHPGAPGPAINTWGPVIDGSLIQDLTYRAFKKGAVVKVPVIFGADTNDGTIWASNCSQTSQQTSNDFIRSNFYNISQAQINVLNQLYPNKPRDFPQCGPWWRQAADVYGDIRYMCPGLFLSTILAHSGISSWNYRYNVQDPDQTSAGLGVPHTVEMSAIFGPGNLGGAGSPSSYQPGQKNAGVIPILQGYWTSFIKNYDPNPSRYAGTAQWDRFDPSQAANNGTARIQFVSPPDGSTAMEVVDPDQWKRCQYLWSIAEDLQL